MYTRRLWRERDSLGVSPSQPGHCNMAGLLDSKLPTARMPGTEGGTDTLPEPQLRADMLSTEGQGSHAQGTRAGHEKGQSKD